MTSISSNSVTLADYATMSNNPLVQRVTYSLIQYSNVIQDVPLVEKRSLVANGARFEGNLPTVNWSQLNAEGATTKGVPTAYQEQVYIIRNYIDVDKFLVMDENAIVDPRATQIEAYLKALTYDLNDKYFNNDHVTGDANSFVGLKYRINNGGTFGVRSENLINGGGLDVTQTTLGTTPVNGNKLLEFIDQLLWSVDSPDGEGVILYMNEQMKRRFNFALRQLGTSGGLNVSQDQFNRTIEQYKGAIIRDPGYKADQSTRIITSTETSAGAAGSSNYTSIYAVNYSMDHMFGWQFEPPNVQDLGLIWNGAIYRTLIDWAVGLMNTSTRSLGRIYGLKIS